MQVPVHVLPMHMVTLQGHKLHWDLATLQSPVQQLDASTPQRLDLYLYMSGPQESVLFLDVSTVDTTGARALPRRIRTTGVCTASGSVYAGMFSTCISSLQACWGYKAHSAHQFLTCRLIVRISSWHEGSSCASIPDMQAHRAHQFLTCRLIARISSWYAGSSCSSIPVV